MGILRNREELLPVTCAVLKEDEREMFFNDVRRKAGGNMDRVAKTVGVPVNTLQDWVNGAANVPYITLQRLASEFEVEMPTVTELRREYQQIAPTAPQRKAAPRLPAPSGPVGGAGRREPRRRREEGVESGGREYEPLRSEAAPKASAAPARERRERPQRGERRGRQKAEKRAQQPKQARAAKQPAGPRVPKLSDQAAYWAGATLAAARREGDVLVFAADKRVGQNYASTWAGLCSELFGVKAALSMSEDRRCQEARLPTAGLEDFVGRLDLKPDAPRPPAPRWAWSNADWKKAFLKGLVDASAEFRRAPALHIAPLGEPLRRSAEKLFAGLGLTVTAAEDGSLTLAGAEALEKYRAEVGTDNLKLRDQLKAYFRGGAAPAAEAPAEGEAPARTGRRRRRGRRGRGAAETAAPVAEVTEHGTELGEGGHFTEPSDLPPPAAPEETPPPERELPVDERAPEV